MLEKGVLVICRELHLIGGDDGVECLSDDADTVAVDAPFQLLP